MTLNHSGLEYRSILVILEQSCLWTWGAFYLLLQLFHFNFYSRFTGLLWNLGSASKVVPSRHMVLVSFLPLVNCRYSVNKNQGRIKTDRYIEYVFSYVCYLFIYFLYLLGSHIFQYSGFIPGSVKWRPFGFDTAGQIQVGHGKTSILFSVLSYHPLSVFKTSLHNVDVHHGDHLLVIDDLAALISL